MSLKCRVFSSPGRGKVFTNSHLGSRINIIGKKNWRSMRGVQGLTNEENEAKVSVRYAESAWTLGISSIVVCWIPVVGILLGVIAGSNARLAGPIPRGRSGRFLGRLGIVLSVAVGLAWVAVIITALDAERSATVARQRQSDIDQCIAAARAKWDGEMQRDSTASSGIVDAYGAQLDQDLLSQDISACHAQ